MVVQFGPLGPDAASYYIEYENGEQGYDWERVRAEHLAALSDEDKQKMAESCAHILALSKKRNLGENTALERARVGAMPR